VLAKFSSSFVGVLMYDLTRLRYSSWSIFVRAYPTMRMFLGRKLLRWRPKRAGKVFFLARSPEAPSTTMMVLSLSSLLPAVTSSC